jgi:predicted ABC-type ATPase
MIKPTFYLVAGPNGAGKTVFTKKYFQSTVIRPDDLLADFHISESFALQALVDKKMKDALAEGKSFALEHNLHTATVLSRPEMATKSGFQTTLVYLAIESVELCISRVEARYESLKRAESGQKVNMLFTGHTLPEDEIRRRYRDSLATLKTSMKAFDEGVILDNSDYLRGPLFPGIAHSHTYLFSGIATKGKRNTFACLGRKRISSRAFIIRQTTKQRVYFA